MPPSKLKQDDTRVRRTKLLALRRQGIRYDDDRIMDLGYASPDAARRDLNRALEQHRDEERAEVGIYRQQENERLDSLLEAAWPQATKPQPVLNKEGEVVAMTVDMRAVDTVLRLMDRRAKLNGLDMPAKTEVTGADGGPLQLGPASATELEALIRLGGGNPEAGQDQGDAAEPGDRDDQ